MNINLPAAARDNGLRIRTCERRGMHCMGGCWAVHFRSEPCGLRVVAGLDVLAAGWVG